MPENSKSVSLFPKIIRTFCVLLVITVCGWLVMQLEIMGGRMLQPDFGNTIPVWGSVIGVFLLSLSFGYLLGGWISNSGDRGVLLGSALFLAGVWIYFIPCMRAPVCAWLWNTGVDEKWGALVAALILFAVPSVLLATTSPAAVRWLTSEARKSGLVAGFVLFFSTVASFAGCIVTSFYLVLYSVRMTTRISGGILCVVGLALIVSGTVSRFRQSRGRKGD